MKNKDFVPYAFNTVGAVCTAIQPDEILQYVSLALTVLATLISILFTIYRWYKSATEDGKITKDEVDELIDELQDKTKNAKEDKDNGKK